MTISRFCFVSAILFLSVIVQGGRLQNKLRAEVAAPVVPTAPGKNSGGGGGTGSEKKCSTENLKITQVKSGIEVVGQAANQDRKIPEWQVTILNDCPCSQSRVKISCSNFQTVEYIEPAIFNATAPAACLLNNGLPINPHSGLTFTYAWASEPFQFNPISSDVLCT